MPKISRISHARAVRALEKAEFRVVDRNFCLEFIAVVERDEEWFIAYAPEVPGANGQGKTKETPLGFHQRPPVAHRPVGGMGRPGVHATPWRSSF